MTFDDLMARWDWVPIRNCPGRYRLTGERRDAAPGEVLGPDSEVREYTVEKARDTVLVARFTGGGLISYRRSDGTFVHTLNTPEGLTRKLLDLGIESGGPDCGD